MLINKNLNIVLFSVLVFITVIVNQPVLSISFIPRLPRLIFEAFILLLLAGVVLKNYDKKSILIILSLGGASLCGYLITRNHLNFYVGFFNKLSFAILFSSLLHFYPSTIEKFKKLWVLVWSVICFWVFLGAFIYVIDPSQFTLVDFKEVDIHAPYHYHISSLGHVTVNAHFGSSLLRFCGVFFEPIHLGFFAWINIIFAPILFLKKRSKLIYTFMSICLGVLSLSGAFALVFLICFPLIAIRTFSVKPKNHSIYYLLATLLAIVISVFIIDFNSFGSLYIRFEKYQIGLRMFLDNDFKTLFFGNGLDKNFEYGKYAFSSAYLGLLINNGLVVLLIAFYLIYNWLKWDKVLLFSMLIFLLMLNPSSFLLFYFLIVLGHHIYEEKINS